MFTADGEEGLNGLIPGPGGCGVMAQGLRKILFSTPFVDRKRVFDEQKTVRNSFFRVCGGRRMQLSGLPRRTKGRNATAESAHNAHHGCRARSPNRRADS